MAGRAAVVVGCVGRVLRASLLALLAFLLAVPAPGAGSLGLTPVVYSYDGAGSTAEAAPQDAPQAEFNQDVRGRRTSTAPLRSGYDDRSNLARASARLDGYRLAPNTASTVAGVADDVPLHSPSFVAHPNGEIVPVPRGAVGPVPAETGRGFQFRGGSGGHGFDPRV